MSKIRFAWVAAVLGVLLSVGVLGAAPAILDQTLI